MALAIDYDQNPILVQQQIPDTDIAHLKTTSERDARASMTNIEAKAVAMNVRSRFVAALWGIAPDDVRARYLQKADLAIAIGQQKEGGASAMETVYNETTELLIETVKV